MKIHSLFRYELGYEPTLFRTPRKPLKTKGFPPHPSLTTPPHHDFVEVVRDGCGGGGSGVGVVCVSVEVWVRRGGGGLGVEGEKRLTGDIGYIF